MNPCLRSAFAGFGLILTPFGVLASCLDEAAIFSERICGEISNRGSSQLISGSGELNAEAKGLIARMLSSVQGNAKVDAAVSTYDNVVREELTNEHKTARDCKTRMVDDAVKQVCIKPVTYRTCPHPDFGQAGWAQEETLQGTSGWRGGGYNQDAYCSDYSNAVISSHGLGGQPYNVVIMSKSEEGRWTGRFNRDRQYNYHCRVKLSWVPVYNERQDARCGPPE